MCMTVCAVCACACACLCTCPPHPAVCLLPPSPCCVSCPPRYNLTEAVGSWAYMAPEVVLGQPYNEKVDVFSFGVILFEVLNRKLMLVDEIKTDPRKDAQVTPCRSATACSLLLFILYFT